MSSTSPDPEEPFDNMPNYSPDDEPEPASANGCWNVSRRSPSGDWLLLEQNIEAGTRRSAVRQAIRDLPDEECWGQFLVERDGDAKVLTREKKIVETVAENWL